MLVSVAVETASQVEQLRRIRNITADGFSHDTSQISMLQQHSWWIKMRGRIRAWLYISEDVIVGYGLVRQTDDGKWWNSLAVLPPYQRHGYGSEITHDLVVKHSFRADFKRQPLYASVRRNNLAALAMHHFDDWQIIDGPDDELVYFQSRVGGKE